jgi:hypothetical protein
MHGAAGSRGGMVEPGPRACRRRHDTDQQQCTQDSSQGHSSNAPFRAGPSRSQVNAFNAVPCGLSRRLYRDEVFRLRRLSIEGVRYELEYDHDPVRVCSTLAFLADVVFAVTKT